MIPARILPLAIVAALALPTLAGARPGYVWQIDQGETYSVLHYGVPPSGGEQDMPGVMCERGRGYSMILFVPSARYPTRETDAGRVDARGRAGPWPVTLTVNGQAYPAEATFEVDDEVIQVTARLPAAAPPLVAFQRTGQLRLSALGVTAALPAAPSNLRVRFFGFCRR